MAIQPAERVPFLLGNVLNDLHRAHFKTLTAIDAFFHVKASVVIFHMNRIMLTNLFTLLTGNAAGRANLPGIAARICGTAFYVIPLSVRNNLDDVIGAFGHTHATTHTIVLINMGDFIHHVDGIKCTNGNTVPIP